MFETFIFWLAVVLGTWYSIRIIATLYYSYKYEGSIEQQIDLAFGKRTIFRIKAHTGLLTVVCWVWVIVNLCN